MKEPPGARLWILFVLLGLTTAGLHAAPTAAAAFDTGGQIATAGFTLSTSALSIPEGSTNTYTVRLATAPSADVTVTLTKNSTGDDNITFDTDPDTTGNQSTLTFTSTNWNLNQTVAVAAAQDTDKLNGTATITHTATSTDSNYNNIAASLTATEGDNDVCEGSTAVGNLTTLVGDCNILLSTKAIFDSTAVLNWSPDLAMNSWQGIQYSNGRVSNISLLSKNLTGQIPKEFGNLTELTTLALSSNSLDGPIPSELGDLTKLTGLDLNYNNLSGPIPEELGNLTKLTQLTLRNNNLSGTIPEELGDLTKLKWLNLGSNNLSGTIPEELGDLTKLTQLTLSRNNLSGTIPEQIGDLTELTLLHLDENNLSGTVPEELGDLTKLIQLHLDENNLSGTIPEQIGNLTELLSLLLGSNSLSGPIPTELGDLTNLKSLYLHRNNLSGPIPVQLGNLTKLTSLALSTNNLTEAIPGELGNLTKLTLLALHENSLEGDFPGELGYLTKLNRLIMYDNNLTGCVPLSLAAFITGDKQINPQTGGVRLNVCPLGPTFDQQPSPTPDFDPFWSGTINGPDFCANLSLAGVRTYAHDFDDDVIADTCSLPHTRREAVARQMAADTLAKAYQYRYDDFLVLSCHMLGDINYGESPEDLARDICATGTTPPVTPQEPQDTGLFYSGIIPGPDFCTDLSLGGIGTYAHDFDDDGIADTCSLPYTRREAVARYMAADTLIENNRYQYMRRIDEACNALGNTDFGDHPDHLAEDICANE